MYDLIARTAGLILLGGCLVTFLWVAAKAPTPQFLEGWSTLQRWFIYLAALIFLMLVIDWASGHQQVRY